MNKNLVRKRKLVFVSVNSEFYEIIKKYIPLYEDLDIVTQQLIIEALGEENTCIDRIEPEDFYMNIMCSHGTPNEISTYYEIDSIMVIKLQLIYQNNLKLHMPEIKKEMANETVEKIKHNEQMFGEIKESISNIGNLPQPLETGKDKFVNGVNAYAAEILNKMSIEQKLEFIGYISNTEVEDKDNDTEKPSEVVSYNPLNIDTTGRTIRAGDIILMFNPTNRPAKWSYEIVIDVDGELCTVFKKFMSEIISKISNTKPEHLVVIKSDESLLFHTDEFGWK